MRPGSDGAVLLDGRGTVVVGGAGRMSFLQNLVTNDLRLLDTQAAIYAALLTAQGKFLHDFFIVEQGETLVLECEGGARAEDLARRLSTYRLRATVEITVRPSVTVWALPSEADFPADLKDSALVYPDPRHAGMGRRALMAQDLIPLSTPGDFDFYDRRRIALCLPDGSRDILPEQDTVIEAGLDRCHGVSFTKGCYVGQELTARLHHRGLAKKRLRAIRTALDFPPWGADIRLKDGRLAGTMRSSCGDAGLAMLRDDLTDALWAEGIFIPV
ncbi:MAG TPA: folate-binding protein [Alphaproteobacteria bacterium]|nr:folate-binding protein [Alphaproteobacteria bacterium]